jgi:hypothetical protein
VSVHDECFGESEHRKDLDTEAAFPTGASMVALSMAACVSETTGDRMANLVYPESVSENSILAITDDHPVRGSSRSEPAG